MGSQDIVEILFESNITEMTRIIKDCLPRKVGDEPIAFADVVNYVRQQKDDENLSVGVIVTLMIVNPSLYGLMSFSHY